MNIQIHGSKSSLDCKIGKSPSFCIPAFHRNVQNRDNWPHHMGFWHSGALFMLLCGRSGAQRPFPGRMILQGRISAASTPADTAHDSYSWWEIDTCASCRDPCVCSNRAVAGSSFVWLGLEKKLLKGQLQKMLHPSVDQCLGIGSVPMAKRTNNNSVNYTLYPIRRQQD